MFSGSISNIEIKKMGLDLKARTYVMGVLNVTPDSFSDGGLFFDEDIAVNRCLELEKQGADIIDLGGESTRPAAGPVSIDEELKRVLPVIIRARSLLNIPISIDTYKSKVAQEALKAGASIVNDISALRFDPEMADVVAKHNAFVILMHIKGTPLTMQDDPKYGDVVKDIIAYLEESIAIAKSSGVSDDKIIIDPGIGFGKTPEHNLEILNRLDELKVLKKPIAIGTSRKSFIGKVLDLDVNDRLVGSLTSATVAICKGANIVRVHDVAESKQAAKMADSIIRRKQER